MYKMGENTKIYDGVYLGENVEIGNNVTIYPYAIIGTPPEYIGDYWCNGKVYIGDNTIIREFVTITMPIKGDTIIGNDCYLMSKSHVAHDAELKNGVVLSPGAMIGGHSKLGNFCRIGLNASTHQWSDLSDLCMVGANGFFKGKSPRGVIWAGIPSKPLKINDIGIKKNIDNNYTKEEITKEASDFLDSYCSKKEIYKF